MRTAILLIILAFTASYAYCAESGNTALEKKLLESELLLAKKPDIYIVLDFASKKVFIKSRGLILKAMVIEKLKLWGASFDLAPLSLSSKDAFSEPQRIDKTPGAIKNDVPAVTNSTAFEFDALELDDMPTMYRLTLDNGLIITVRPEGSDARSTFYTTSYAVGWQLSRPLITVWSKIRSKPYSEVQLVLSQEDARALYWAFLVGFKCIIIPPE